VRNYLFLVMVAVTSALGLTQAKQSSSPVKQPPQPKLSRNRCNDRMFAPNYTAEVGVFESVRWDTSR
jgi:hypothetical protein